MNSFKHYSTSLNDINFYLEIVKNIHFIGEIESNETDAHLVDFGILTKCDHLILSHGTFGLWAAILSSKDNLHVMPFKTFNNKGEDQILEETSAIMSSGFDNFLYMTEL